MALNSSNSLPRTDSAASSINQTSYGANVSRDDEASKAMNIVLLLEAKGLPNMDKRGKSDPFVVVYQKNETNPSNSTSSTSSLQEQWKKIGQTETVYNNLNPKWTKNFPIEYSFGCNSTLKFDIYDRDVDNNNLQAQDYIGQVKCTVAQIVLADDQRLTLQVHKKNARPGARTGTLTIRGEEQKGDLGDSVTLQFAVSGLRRGKKPFYILSRKNRNDDDFSPVVYSEVHQSYNGPNQITVFRPVTKTLARLVNGDLDRELQVEFQDFDRGGRHYRGGKAKFTLKAIKTACAANGNARINLSKRKTNGQIVDAGILIIRKCDISIPFSFIDYIQSGVVINTIIAVDMSNSNGNPSDPNSLHFNNPATPNEYAIALRQVGGVLAAYDTDKKFPAFGFGAALPPDFLEPDHCFALTGYIMQPYCDGINGVVDIYYKALNHVAPYEPCKYGPVLERVIKMTKEEEERSGGTTYTVLLLITDGEFADFSETADLICSAADLPLSIVIVGVGNSRFLNLEKLDGDKERLCSSDGTPCSRDIVQFVQFHKHRHNPTQLSKEVLDEIPEQLVSYMRSKGFKPSDIANINPDDRKGNHPSGLGPYVPPSATRPDAMIPQSHPSGGIGMQPSMTQSLSQSGIPGIPEVSSGIGPLPPPPQPVSTPLSPPPPQLPPQMTQPQMTQPQMTHPQMTHPPMPQPPPSSYLPPQNAYPMNYLGTQNQPPASQYQEVHQVPVPPQPNIYTSLSFSNGFPPPAAEFQQPPAVPHPMTQQPPVCGVNTSVGPVQHGQHLYNSYDPTQQYSLQYNTQPPTDQRLQYTNGQLSLGQYPSGPQMHPQTSFISRHRTP